MTRPPHGPGHWGYECSLCGDRTPFAHSCGNPQCPGVVPLSHDVPTDATDAEADAFLRDAAQGDWRETARRALLSQMDAETVAHYEDIRARRNRS